MSFAKILAAHDRAPADNALRQQLAEAALREGEEERALDRLAPIAVTPGEPRLLQWVALLYRALDRRRESIAAFESAAASVRADAGIAHGLAQVSFEAGLPAVDLFENALRLAPKSGEVVLGLAASRLAVGQGEQAILGLSGTLTSNPHWTEGHEKLAQLRWMLGYREPALDSFEEALRTMPTNASLWRSMILLLVRSGHYATAEGAIMRARSALGEMPFLDANEAVVRSELGQTESADKLFAQLAGQDDETLAVHMVRHQLRNARLPEAAVLIKHWLRLDSNAMWPYASIVWRLAGDGRWRWLEGDPALISVVDISDRLPPIDQLAAVLRGLHQGRCDPLGQSVHGGTQTDGHLLARIEPEIEQLRGAIRAAVSAYLSQFPKYDPKHPTLGRVRNRPIRFAGSWSVRLSGEGYHRPHVHPLGWISSALYLATPVADDREPSDAGYLTLGLPEPHLANGLSPLAVVQPKPGHLVLFPSTMWHGTNSFLQGERLTMAFDVAAPLETVPIVG